MRRPSEWQTWELGEHRADAARVVDRLVQSCAAIYVWYGEGVGPRAVRTPAERSKPPAPPRARHHSALNGWVECTERRQSGQRHDGLVHSSLHASPATACSHASGHRFVQHCTAPRPARHSSYDLVHTFSTSVVALRSLSCSHLPLDLCSGRSSVAISALHSFQPWVRPRRSPACLQPTPCASESRLAAPPPTARSRRA